MYNMLQKWGRNGYRKCTRTRSKNKVTVLIDSKQLINDNFVGQTVKLLSIFVFLFWNQRNICICLWYLNKNGVSQFECMEIGAECFYTRLCICACWMSLSLPGSVGFCLFGTDQYVLLGSFWLNCVAWVKPPAVLEEPNSAIGLLDISQNMASPKGRV